MRDEDGGKARSIRRALAGFVLVLAGVATVACSKSAADAEEGNFSADAETAKIERIVRNYVINHPEIITEAFQRREERAMAKLVDEHRKDIETPFAGAWAGARDGDVVLVEFFDYACPYCKASNAIIDRLLAEDKNLKVVWRELPVLGPNSQAAAEASLTAAKQGKFKQFYDRLFAEGRPSPETIARAQKAVGVAPIQVPEANQEFDKNSELARKLGASGTPTFVIGDKIVHGAESYDVLKQAIAEARKKA